MDIKPTVDELAAVVVAQRFFAQGHFREALELWSARCPIDRLRLGIRDGLVEGRKAEIAIAKTRYSEDTGCSLSLAYRIGWAHEQNIRQNLEREGRLAK